MTVLRIKDKGYAEIEREFGPLLEAMVSTDPKTARRVLTSDDIRELLNRCDDVDSAYEPLGAAVFNFLLQRNGQILLDDS